MPQVKKTDEVKKKLANYITDQFNCYSTVLAYVQFLYSRADFKKNEIDMIFDF